VFLRRFIEPLSLLALSRCFLRLTLLSQAHAAFSRSRCFLTLTLLSHAHAAFSRGFFRGFFQGLFQGLFPGALSKGFEGFPRTPCGPFYSSAFRGSCSPKATRPKLLVDEQVTELLFYSLRRPYLYF
jgi:hypothetical protein